MADERVVIRIDINADTRGIDRVRRKLRELAAEAEVLDRRMERVNNRFEANAEQTDRLTASHTRANRALRDHDRSQERFSNRLNRTSRRLDFGQKAAKRFAGILSTGLKFALIGATIEMVALGAAVATVNGLFTIGQATIKLYRFAMAGVAYAAAAVTAGVATAAAAQREYNAAMVAYRYKSMPALGSGTAQAMSALRMLTSDQQLATFGFQNLNAAFAAVSKNAEFSPALSKALRGIGDFAVASGDMGKGLTAAANFIGLLQKSGSLTEDVLSAAAEVGPEFQKSIEEAQKRGLTSADALMKAMASGELSKTAGLDGALSAINDTLMGQLKAFLTEMIGRFADIGQTFLPGVKQALFDLSSIFRVTLNRVSADLSMFGSGKLLDDIVRVTGKLADIFVTLFEKYLPQSEGMLGKLGGFFGDVGDIFMKIRQFLEPMRDGAKVITDTFGPVIINILKGFGDSMQLISNLAVENRDEFLAFGDALSNVFDKVQRYFNDYKQAFVQGLPFITNLFNAFANTVGGLLTVLEKLFNLVGDGPQAGLLAVLLTGGTMMGISKLKDFGLGKNRQRGGIGDWMTGAAQRITSGNVQRPGGMSAVGTMTVTATAVYVNGPIMGGGGGRGGKPGQPGAGGAYPPGTLLGPDGLPLAPSGGGKLPPPPNLTRAQRAALKMRGLSTGTKVAGGLTGLALMSGLTGSLMPENPFNQEGLLSGAISGLQTGGQIGMIGGPKVAAIAALATAQIGAISGHVRSQNYAPGLDVLNDPLVRGLSMNPQTFGIPMIIGQIAAYLDDRDERDKTRAAAGEMSTAMGTQFGTTLFSQGAEAGKRSLTSINETINEIVTLGDEFNGMGWKDRISKAEALLAQGTINQEQYAVLASEHHGTYIKALNQERDALNEFSTNAMSEYQRKIQSLTTATGMSDKEIEKLATSMGVDLSDASISLADAVSRLGLAMEMTTDQLLASLRKVAFQVIEDVFGRERKKYEGQKVLNQAAEELRGGGNTREQRVKFLETLTSQANNIFPDDPFKALQFVMEQVGPGGKQFQDALGPLFGQEGEFGDVQGLISEYQTQTRTKGLTAFASQFGANMLSQGIQVDQGQLLTMLQGMPLDQLTTTVTTLNNTFNAIKNAGLTGESGMSVLDANLKYLKIEGLEAVVKTQEDTMASNIQAKLSESAQEIRTALREAIDSTPKWWSEQPPWWNTTPGGGSLTAPGGIGGADGDPTTPGDTRTRRAFGDSVTSQLGRTMARHGFFNSKLSGKRTITSSFRNWGLGSINSDHVTGNAYDLTGDNLGSYASMVNGMGGFAEFHGAGGSRHLHVVPGQTPVGDAMSPVGATSAPVSVGGSTYNITVNATAGQDVNAIAAAVMTKIEAKERSNRERA